MDDGDVVWVAQATKLIELGYETTIATSNVKHLIRFVPAQKWETIAPQPE